MIDYNALRDEIIDSLVGRPNGTQIQPTNHQHFALDMLDYIRSLELALQSTLMGFADVNTIPHQPDDARVSYVAAVNPNSTNIYTNFYDINGNSISVTSNDNQGLLVILIWNMQFWSYEVVPAGQATYYAYNIRKTYDSIATMNADLTLPVATDGTPILIGEIVSVVNQNNSNEDGLYTYEGTLWRFQCSFSIYGDDVNHNQVSVTDSISGTTLTKNINLGLLNNPIYEFDCDSDTFQTVKLNLIFNKLNNAKIIIHNTGSSVLTFNTATDLTSSPNFTLPFFLVRNTNQVNTINAGEVMVIDFTTFNYINENSVERTSVFQSLSIFDSITSVH